MDDKAEPDVAACEQVSSSIGRHGVAFFFGLTDFGFLDVLCQGGG